MMLNITSDLRRRKLDSRHPKCVRGQARHPRAGLGFHASAHFQRA